MGNTERLIHLYDDRLWKDPTEDLYRENMFSIFCEAQRHRIVDFALSPTGKTRGFSRLKALRSTMDGYSQYLQFISARAEPSVKNLFGEISPVSGSPYELASLSNAILGYFRESPLFAEHYDFRETTPEAIAEASLSRRPLNWTIVLSRR